MGKRVPVRRQSIAYSLVWSLLALLSIQAACLAPLCLRARSSSMAPAKLVKPLSDKCDYKFLTLKNGLHAVVVSDPDTDKAAAALDVRVGSLLDPDHLQGLAHFTEHMLFYSSEKYPVEDEYSKFISEHGGHTNAYTAAEDTNYQFDVNWDHLEPALDRFAQFFICPLISPDGVEREVQAVDSEHGKNLNSDPWRNYQLFKHTANKGHPWAKFFTGNKATLLDTPSAAGVDVRAAVASFHASHYSANLMKLCVYGRQPVEELAALVDRLFSGVPTQGLAVPAFAEDVLQEEHRGQLLRIVPVRDGHHLELHWDIPPTDTLFRATPTSYLSHLLGHEGAGSAFALLKAKGWATALVAGESGNGLSSRGFFYVRVDLTDAGHAAVTEVTRLVFRYLDLLRAPGGISQELFGEMQALQRLRFDWRDKQPPYSTTTALASSLHHYPEDVLLLAIFHVPQDYDPDCIRGYLDQLTPARARVHLISKTYAEPASGAPPLQVEPIYGTQFSQEPLPAEWLAAWSSGEPVEGLHLPATNPFLPTDFSLRPPPPGPPEGGAPVVLREEPRRLRLLHRTELRFEQPKAVAYLDFQCPAAYASPESSVATRLVVKLADDYLNELTYPAELAGLSYHLHNTLTGFQLTASGYNHKLPLLVGMLVDALAAFEVRPDRFAVVTEALAKEYANVRYQQPYQWAMYRYELALHTRRWRIEEYLEVLPSLTPARLTAFLPTLLGRAFLEALVVGNVDGEEAQALVGGALSKLEAGWGTAGVLPGQEKDLRIVKLPAGVTSVLVEPGPNPKDDNSAALVTYQVGPDALATNALAQLLVQLGKRDAFYQLRTQEQLGYIVHMYVGSEQGVSSVNFLLQSDKFAAAHLAGRVEAYVAKLLDKLASLPEEEFTAGVGELAKAKLERPKRLGELGRRWWGEVSTGAWVWHRQEAEVEELKRLTQQQLVEFAQAVLGPGSSSRRKMAVLVRGKQERRQQQPATVVAAAADAGSCPAAEEGEGSKGESNGSLAAAQGTCPVAPDAAAANGSTSSSSDKAANSPASSQQCPAGASMLPAVGAAGGNQEEDAEAAAAAAAAVGPGEAFQVIHDLWAFKRSCEVYPSSSSSTASVARARADGVGAAAAAAASTGAETAEVSAKL